MVVAHFEYTAFDCCPVHDKHISCQNILKPWKLEMIRTTLGMKDGEKKSYSHILLRCILYNAQLAFKFLHPMKV